MAVKSSFAAILERSKQESVAALIRRAQMANRVAKLCDPKDRERLYAIKRCCLGLAMSLAPHSAYVDSRVTLDEKTLLLGITVNARFRFHVPAESASQNEPESIPAIASQFLRESAAVAA